MPGREFLGRDALAADAAGGQPRRTLMGLRWNHADVVGIISACLGEGGLPDPMELPRGRAPVFDQVLAGGHPVGVSTGRTMSVNLRSTISLCVIDEGHAVPGADVVVLWGRPGTVQREARATVTALPFKPDRRRTDVSAI